MVKFRALVLVLSFSFVAAPVMAGPVENCMAMADVMRDFVNARDRGVTYDKARAGIDDAQLPAKVQATEDVMVTLVYGSPELTPDQLAAQALQACLIAVSGEKP